LGILSVTVHHGQFKKTLDQEVLLRKLVKQLSLLSLDSIPSKELELESKLKLENKRLEIGSHPASSGSTVM